MKKLALIALAAGAATLAPQAASAQVIINNGGGFHHGGFGRRLRGRQFLRRFAFGGFFHQPQFTCRIGSSTASSNRSSTSAGSAIMTTPI
jgi:hypothetical protein